MINLDDLERKAQQSSRGRWEAEGSAIKGPGFYWTLSNVVDESHNTAYIEAAQPQAILELIEEITILRANNARLEQWVTDLQSGLYVNCVYCGHRYGPGETTPVAMADALKAHIEQCPQHPMSLLKEAVDAAITDLILVGEIHGARHKQYGIDQALRHLFGQERYRQFVADALDEGEAWDRGIAP